jgi:hypothetical protein
MNGVGRSNCRATDAEIVYLIDQNEKLGGYSVWMELSEIIVDCRGIGRDRFLRGMVEYLEMLGCVNPQSEQ